MTNTEMKEKEKSASIETTAHVEAVKKPECHDNSGKEDNLSVKLAMAAELIEMGISKSSAHKILNIREA